MMRLFLTLLTGMGLASSAWAFPEMVRHKYVNCTACHISPTGGGVLSPYGREMSKELLSTWSREGEQGYLNGLLSQEKLGENTVFGGDVRFAQVHREDENVREGRFIKMQADLEPSFRVDNATFTASLGLIQKGDVSHFGTHRFSAMYALNDEMTLRAGRFYAAYGLNIPEHVASIRRDLGFNPDQETHNLEYAWLGENWNVYSTLIAKRWDKPTNQQMEGASFQVNRVIADTYKIGLSHWTGKVGGADRQMSGAHAILGFTPKLYGLSEYDFTSAGTHGRVQYHKLGYEAVRGLHVFALREHTKTDVKSDRSVIDTWGVGSNWYPRPHFEFQFTWEKMKIHALSEKYGDVAWLILHYYL